MSLLMVAGCSNKKNSFTRRVYNNLTAHYNTWWNGNEALKEGFTTIEKSTPDNYTQILPVFVTPTKKETAAVGAKAERAIEKGSKVIQRNSMYFGKKEYNRWIDDSYFMIGKAYFLKQDYRSARYTFEFILNKYKNSDITWEVLIWLAHTNNQLEQYSKSATDLERVKVQINKGILPRRLMVMFNKVYAEHYLMQKMYDNAVPHLLNAKTQSHSKDEKNRIRFILGQIYMSKGDLNQATQSFKEVVRHSPTYQMEFNARINIAKCYDATKGNSKEIIETLNKMAEDAKNIDYLDQIYYAIAEVQFKDKDTTSGMESLRLSVAKSKSNTFQRALSAVTLADLYFEKPNYPMARAYYDTTLSATSKEAKHYKSLEEKTKVLGQLVTNLEVITTQDSLQKLAKMPEADRMTIIQGIIAKILEEEKKKQEEELARQNDMAMSGQNMGGFKDPTSTTGGWYFYNTAAMSQGFSEFNRKWGRRKLEDLWRLSNKEMSAVTEVVADNQGTPDQPGGQPGDSAVGKDGKGEGKVKPSNDPHSPDMYLSKLPLTPEAMLKSDKLIVEALYQAAFIYREGLKDSVNSTATFKELVTRYPDTTLNSHYLLSCYMLATSYPKLGMEPEGLIYKNIILQNYPNSDYAFILRDPEYIKEMEAKEKQAEVLYENTYNAFKAKQYYIVIMNSDQIIQQDPKNPLVPRFELLKALSSGKLESNDSLAINLQRIARKYPRDPIAKEAMTILEKLSKLDPDALKAGGIVLEEQKQTPDSIVANTPYKFNANSEHYMLIIVNPSEIEVNALKIRLSDQNSKSFTSENLTVSSVLYGSNSEIINIGRFKSSTKAMLYFETLQNTPYITGMFEGKKVSVMVISSENYPLFYRSGDIDNYMKFFEKFYQKAPGKN